MTFNLLSRSWSFFQPMLKKSRSQVTFGPFLRGIRLIRFPQTTVSTMVALKDRELRLVSRSQAEMLSSTVKTSLDSQEQLLASVQHWFTLGRRSSLPSSPSNSSDLVLLLPKALYCLDVAGYGLFTPQEIDASEKERDWRKNTTAKL